MTRQKRITLDDIAKLAGCSKTAVSYAIRHNHSLSDELKTRIWQIIDEQGYRPYGTHLKPPETTVALLTTLSSSGALASLFSEELERRGMIMQLHPLPEKINWDSFKTLAALFQSNVSRLAGIINLHPQLNSFDLLKYCKNIPSVIYYREGSMCSRVIVKLQKIGELAARFLLQSECREAAFLIFRDTESVFSACVYDTMEEFLRKKQPDFKLQKISMLLPELRPRMDQAYADGVRMFCAHGGTMAHPVLQWAYEANRRIPDDISMFCIDYANEAEQMIPPLTSISLPHRQLVRYTVDELFALINHVPPTERELFPFLVKHNSTKK